MRKEPGYRNEKHPDQGSEHELDAHDTPDVPDIPFSPELRVHHISACDGTEDHHAEDQVKLVDQIDCRQGRVSERADHHGIQQVHRIGDDLLKDQRQCDHCQPSKVFFVMKNIE